MRPEITLKRETHESRNVVFSAVKMLWRDVEMKREEE